MQFHIFMNSFDTCVHNARVRDDVKLNRLIELCEGKDLKVIKPCALMNLKARTLLVRR